MRRSGSMSVGLVVGLVALVLVYKKMVVDAPGENSAIEQAVSALDSEGQADRDRAHDILLEAESESVVALLAALKNPEARRPEEIIRALERIGDEQAIAGLREVLSSHPDALARRCAASALAEMPDRDAQPLLEKRTVSDPSLQVRQAALLAMADLGQESLVRDLASLLDPSTVAELRQSANDTLEGITDQEFQSDLSLAEAWLEEQAAAPRQSVVSGVGAEPGQPLTSAGETSIQIERGDDRLRFDLTGKLELPMNLLLQMDQGRIVIELTRDAARTTALCYDTPATGRRLARHAPIEVDTSDDRLRFSIPRVGQLVAPELPRSVTIISQ